MQNSSQERLKTTSTPSFNAGASNWCSFKGICLEFDIKLGGDIPTQLTMVAVYHLFSDRYDTGSLTGCQRFSLFVPYTHVR